MHNRINENIIKKITIPHNVTVVFINGTCIFSGPNGKIQYQTDKNIDIDINEKIITIKIELNEKEKKSKKLAIINTTVALFKNNIYGVLNFFEKTLNLKGIGYKAEYKNNMLKLYLGHSHPVIYNIPHDIHIDLLTPINILIKGISKHKVGQIAHEIKMIRPVEVYKGNGIKYKDEIIKIKSPKKSK